VCRQLPLHEVNTEMFVQISVTVFWYVVILCPSEEIFLTSEGDFQSGTSILLTRSTFPNILTPIVLHPMVFY